MDLIEKLIPESEVVYRPSEPFMATLLENRRLTPEDSIDDIRHLLFDITGSQINYLEGQSVGILVPGLDERGKRHRVRLYSIASSRSGDDGNSNTITLCIKRVVYTDEESGEEVRGLASNFVSDAKPGDKIPLTGPTGRRFLLPASDQVNLVMIAVGTGIAPFRSFINHIYSERGSWGGCVRLFYGAKTGLESVYMNDKNNDIGQYYTKNTFQAFQALSRQETNTEGERVYVQHKIAQQKEKIWPLVKGGNLVLYLCGLKSMESGVDQVFAGWATEDGLDWATIKEELKSSGRWNIEVY